jgi:hypothetical protein
VCIYVCVCMYVYIYIYIYIYISCMVTKERRASFAHVPDHLNKYYDSVNICMCLYVYMCVYMYICMYIMYGHKRGEEQASHMCLNI